MSLLDSRPMLWYRVTFSASAAEPTVTLGYYLAPDAFHALFTAELIYVTEGTRGTYEDYRIHGRLTHASMWWKTGQVLVARECKAPMHVGDAS